MPGYTGTYDIESLLDARFKAVSVIEFGMDTIVQVMQAELAAHEMLTREQVEMFAAVSTDKRRRYGTGTNANEFQEVDEYGRGPTQKIAPGSDTAFPLRLFQFPWGWTAKWFRTKSVADFAQHVVHAQQSHTRKVSQRLREAMFGSANYTFNDHLVDKTDLPIKRFLNADGADIPAGPNGEIFDGSTETHYLGVATAWASATTAQKAADLQNLITQLIEKGHGSQIVLLINRAQENDIRALTATQPRFIELSDKRLIYRATDTPAAEVDHTVVDNREIGLFDAAVVHVKPWIPPGYILVTDPGTAKPLVYRVRSLTDATLAVAHTHETHPLTAEFMEAEFGFGVWTRTNGAVLDVVTGGGTYTDPVIV